jgi:heme A synthase
VCNVLLETPTWLSAMHIATAAALLALLVALTFRAALMPAPARAMTLAAEAR